HDLATLEATLLVRAAPAPVRRLQSPKASRRMLRPALRRCPSGCTAPLARGAAALNGRLFLVGFRRHGCLLLLVRRADPFAGLLDVAAHRLFGPVWVTGSQCREH